MAEEEPAICALWLLLDQEMMSCLKAGDDECFEWAEKILLDPNVPLVYKARALIIKSLRGDAWCMDQAKEAVRMLDEEIRETYEVFPEATYRRAVRNLELLLESGAERKQAHEAAGRDQSSHSTEECTEHDVEADSEAQPDVEIAGGSTHPIADEAMTKSDL